MIRSLATSRALLVTSNALSQPWWQQARGGGVSLVARNFHSSTQRFSDKPSSTTTTDRIITTQWADPAMRQYKFWNREDSTEKEKFKYLLEISPESMKREARILSLSAQDDVANATLHAGLLPMGAKLLGVGESLADFEEHCDAQPNVLFVSPSCPRAMVQLPLVLAAFPSIEWLHVRSAGTLLYVCGRGSCGIVRRDLNIFCFSSQALTLWQARN